MIVEQLYFSLKNYLPTTTWIKHDHFNVFYREIPINNYIEEIGFLEDGSFYHVFYLNSKVYPFENLNSSSIVDIYNAFFEAFQTVPQDAGVQLFWEDKPPSEFINSPWERVTIFGWKIPINDKQIIVPFGPPIQLYLNLSKKVINLIMRLMNEAEEKKDTLKKNKKAMEIYKDIVKNHMKEKNLGWNEDEKSPHEELYFGYSVRRYVIRHQILEEINVNLLGFFFSLILPKEEYYNTSLYNKIETNAKYSEIIKTKPSIKITSSDIPYSPWKKGKGSIKLSCEISFDDMEPSLNYLNI